MLVANLKVVFPAPPAQVVPQKERALVIDGSLTPVPAAIPLDMKSIDIDCNADSPLTIRLREVPTVGLASDECTITVTPANFIKAQAADANQFQFAVNSVRTEADTAPTAPTA